MQNNKLLLFIILIPLLLVYIPSSFFNIKNAGADISFRPPPIVFAIVWPILLLLLGISWYNKLNLSIFYIILSILLGLWIVLYNYSKLAGLITIIISFILCLFLIFYNNNILDLSSLLLIPLALWLIFAGILNIAEIKN